MSHLHNYENYYNIRLLDDLHNYFPDILYSDRFNNNQLVRYIQEETQNLFNLYSNARRRNTISNDIPIIQSESNRTSNVQQVANRQTDRSNLIRMSFDVEDNASEAEIASSLLNLLNGFMTVPTTQSRNFMESVVVRPTQQQIESATSNVELTNSNENCSICQENLTSNNQTLRRINHCHHIFHDSCILEWFNRNVRCPVCRYDIRSM